MTDPKKAAEARARAEEQDRKELFNEPLDLDQLKRLARPVALRFARPPARPDDPMPHVRRRPRHGVNEEPPVNRDSPAIKDAVAKLAAADEKPSAEERRRLGEKVREQAMRLTWDERLAIEAILKGNSDRGRPTTTASMVLSELTWKFVAAAEEAGHSRAEAVGFAAQRYKTSKPGINKRLREYEKYLDSVRKPPGT
jgi:hypothetical protein